MMADENKNDESDDQYHGRSHRVTQTYNQQGKLVKEVFSPLMVDFRLNDVLEIVVGASVLAIPVAYTEEVWNLGENLPWPNILAVFLTSISMVALFVYFIFYRDQLRGHVVQFLLRVVVSYAITLLVVTFILAMFQKLPWQTDPAISIRRVILVGFPACFSATVLDSLK